MFRTAYARTLAIGVAAMFVGLLAAPLVGAQVASAQEPLPVRIRGTIERVDGVTSVIKARRRTESDGRRQCANRRHHQSIAA